MTIPEWGPPDPTECPPVHRGYVARVPPGDILSILETQIDDTKRLLAGLDAIAAEYRYAPGKWSVKDVVGHLCDVERVFSYRALCFARNDPTPLPGFEQDDYVASGGFGARSLPSLLEELEVIRRATLALFRGFDAAAVERRGTASGGELTVRIIAYIIAGHELHHGVVLRERYLRVGSR